jgi:hypothetical protein
MGSRSWTDATTNSIVFQGLSSPDYLRWLARRDLTQSHLVGPFLHEFTHHWCYRSLLGAALAMTELRLNLFAEAYPEGRPIWARDFVASRTLINLLRPLSEGLAQIAEYDLTHTDANAHMATPLGASVLCFGLGADDRLRHAMLQFLRHSTELMERKASLYLKKFEVEDGYLPGYMAAKNVAWSLISRGYNVPIEILLAYLRSYFWDDPQLISILISENMNGGEVAEALHRRFGQRFFDLFNADDLPDRVQSFWRKWSPDHPDQCAEELGCTAEDFTLAVDRLGLLEQHFHELVEKDCPAVERVAGMPVAQVHALVETLADSRRYVEVACADVVLDDSGVITMADNGNAAPELAAWMTLPSGQYTLTCVIPSFGSFLGILATDQQGQVFALVEIQAPESDDGIRESTLRFLRNQNALRDTMTRLRDRFYAIGSKALGSKIVDEILAWSYEQALRFYAAAACARIADPQKLTAAKASLRSHGLKPLFAKDPAAARLVAGMSMLMNTDQVLQQNSNALVDFACFYYLQDHEKESLRAKRDTVLARDEDGLLMRQVGETLCIFI